MKPSPLGRCDLPDELRQQIASLCDEYKTSLQAGKQIDVASLVARIAPGGRTALLAELFALRCEYGPMENIQQVAAKWREQFPEFPRPKHKQPDSGAKKQPTAAPPRLTTEPATAISPPTATKPETQAPAAAALTAADLPLDVAHQIDEICLRFEAQLRAGRQPDVTILAQQVPPTAQMALLKELLALAVEYRSERPAPDGDDLQPHRESAVAETLTRLVGEAGVQPAVHEAETHTFDPEATPRIGDGNDLPGEPTLHVAPADRQIGDYVILEELGRGGMGVVYKARQLRLQRIVALKMVLRGEFASAQEIQRFHQEAESAAQLDHPGIVPVYEVGQSGSRHFFSMAFVEGHTLSQRLLEGPLSTQEAAELIRQLAVAVAYAHSHGIVHRDLKPGNVLIDKFHRPRITDFGLAKRLDTGNELTSTGQIMGTPSYMPPEQARGAGAEIGPHSDVYSLGAVLYACLTGRPPFQAANPVETLRQVLHDPPARPRTLNRAIPVDLETICLKCLAKNPADRYPSAANLALDLGRWLKGEPIRARPIGLARRAAMWCRRHQALTISAAVAVVACMLLGVVSLRNSREQQKSAQRLAQQENDLKAERERVASQRRLSQLTYCDQQREQGMQLCESGRDAPQGLFRLAGALRLATELKDTERQERYRRDFLDATRTLATKSKAALADAGAARLAPVPPVDLALASAVTLAVDQHWIVQTIDQRVLVRRTETGQVAATVDCGEAVVAAAIAPQGGIVALGLSSGAIMQWQLTNGKEQGQRLTGPKDVKTLQYSSDGALLAASVSDSLWVWDAQRDTPLGLPLCVSQQPSSRNILAIRFDDDSATIELLLAASDQSLWLETWPLAPLRWTREIHVLRGLADYRGSSDYSRVATSDGDYYLKRSYADEKYSVQAYRADSDVALGVPAELPQELQNATLGALYCVATPDGNHIGLGSGRLLFVLEPLAGRWRRWEAFDQGDQYKSMLESIRQLRFTPDAKSIVAIGLQRMKIWDLETGRERGIEFEAKIKEGAYVECLAFTPDGAQVVCGLRDSYRDETQNWNSTYIPGTVQIRNFATGEVVRELRVGHLNGVSAVAVSPDGKTGYSAGGDNTVRCWRMSDGEALGRPLEHGEYVEHIAVSPDGARLLSVSRGRLRLWDVQKWEMLGYPVWFQQQWPLFDAQGRVVLCGEPIAAAPLVSGTQYVNGSTVQTMEMSEGKIITARRLGENAAEVASARLNRPGDWVIVVNPKNQIELRSAATGELVMSPITPESESKAVELASEDHEIVALGVDGKLRRWLTPKALPRESSELLDWIEWFTGSTWDPSQPTSSLLDEARRVKLQSRFGKGASQASQE